LPAQTGRSADAGRVANPHRRDRFESLEIPGDPEGKIIMTHDNFFGADGFDDIDMSELDLLEIEVVQTSGTMGIPETGASCCFLFACGSSSCCAEEQITANG
jgi:hypothetical protein